MSIAITLPNGTVKEYPQGTTAAQLAESISTGLGKNAVAGKVDGRLVDLNEPIQASSSVEIITLDGADGLAIYRHSTAHVMAQAIKRIYGEKAVKLGIGPVIEDGFYYDIDIEKPLSTDDLAAIEAEMSKVIQENLPITRREVSREEATALFAQEEEPLKLELIRDLPDDSIISLYEQGEFVDLAAVRIYLPQDASRRSSC